MRQSAYDFIMHDLVENTTEYLDSARCREIGRSCVCFNLRKAARTVTRLYDEALRPSGLKVTQYSLLMAVQAMGPVTLTKLAEITATERTTLTRNFNILQKRGYLCIESGVDRRERQITLTDEGRQILMTALPLWENAQTRIEEGLGKGRIDDFLTGLSEITRLVTDQ